MVRVKHQRRRRGLSGDKGAFSVAGTIYKLDDQGEVEVSEEHAAKLLQGALWTRCSQAPAPKTITPPAPKPAPPVAPPAAPKAAEPKKKGQLEDLDRDELVKRAEALGMRLDKRTSKKKIIAALEAASQRGEK